MIKVHVCREYGYNSEFSLFYHYSEGRVLHTGFLFLSTIFIIGKLFMQLQKQRESFAVGSSLPRLHLGRSSRLSSLRTSPAIKWSNLSL